MIAVLGGTGTVGREVVRALRAAKAPLRLVSRAPARARRALGGRVAVLRGDLDRPATLGRALAGVSRLFYASGIDERYVQRFEALLDAARSAGVQHVVKLSAMEADRDAPTALLRQHAQTDARLTTSGLAWTVLQPNGFYQDLLAASERLRREGRIHAALGAARQALVDLRDVAAVGVLALTRRGHEGQIYELTGPEALTHAEVAAVFARVLRRPVRYVPIAAERARRALRAAGLDAWGAREVSRLYAHLATGAAGRTTDTITKVLKRAPVPLEAWVREHAAAFR